MVTYWKLVTRLEHSGNSVVIDPAFGNNARSFLVNGREFVWTPQPWAAPALGGIPLLAPWANRLDAVSYRANGHRYLLNESLGNLRFDKHHQPIHGLLLFASGWKEVCRDASSVTHRLEFWKVPEWMAQFPFAHAIEMTHRLSGATLEIETAVENLCSEPIPLCIGYHPYFQIPGSHRDDLRVSIAARQCVGLSDRTLPTAERTPVSPQPVALRGAVLDDVFTDLTGEEFRIEGPTGSLRVGFGERYPVAIVYAPADGTFVCIEPMTALTNAFNDPGAPLQQIAPGDTWRESFWVSAGE
jgi:aldose 1-epimerase